MGAEKSFVGRGPRRDRAKLSAALATLSTLSGDGAATVAVVTGGEGVGKHALARWLPRLAAPLGLACCGPTPATRAQNLFEDGRVNLGTIFTAFRGPVLSMLHALVESGALVLPEGGGGGGGEAGSESEASGGGPLGPGTAAGQATPAARAEALGQRSFVTLRRHQQSPPRVSQRGGGPQGRGAPTSAGRQRSRSSWTSGLEADKVAPLLSPPTPSYPLPASARPLFCSLAQKGRECGPLA